MLRKPPRGVTEITLLNTAKRDNADNAEAHAPTQSIVAYLFLRRCRNVKELHIFCSCAKLPKYLTMS